MSIKFTKAEEQPALKYDHWFLRSLTLEQESETNNLATPKYTLKVQYQLFGVDENNVRHFKNVVDNFIIDDYVTIAYMKAMSGESDLMDAMIAIELALAKIVQDQLDVGTTEVA